MTDNHNPDVLQNFFNEMMTRGLVANTDSLAEINDRMNEAKAEDLSEVDPENACLHEMKAIESAFGPLFGSYRREDDRIFMDMSTKDMGFVTNFIRTALMIMEAFGAGMARQREIATDVEALVNNLVVKPHCEETAHETFSFMVDQGFESRLVDMMATAMAEATETNIFHHVAQYLLELALVPRDSHGAQRMLSQLVSGSMVERFAMEQIRQKPAKPAIRAVQGTPATTPGTPGNTTPKATENGKKASFLSVVKRD
ncbi:hypothetical protein DV532_25865 (plasmid) [Pseudomonas sp. Leaf58]|uniref:hypothetical protein n=1 Tax=unclassified Pseudomonas TaxID=196821 RepID=UPI0006FEA4A5|nr:hypothetical protein [Pseudomonas sp. Leaf58]AYG47720.1 hypothetical protein DV532_25865 [Pseudomonas sp. Leaf58]